MQADKHIRVREIFKYPFPPFRETTEAERFNTVFSLLEQGVFLLDGNDLRGLRGAGTRLGGEY